MTTTEWLAELRRQHPGVQVNLEERPGGWLYLDALVVPAARREQGQGSAVMRELIAYADERGLSMALVPAGDYGGSPRRLRRFYARFGFEQPGRVIPAEVVEPASNARARVMVRWSRPGHQL
jgi:GNAT superfamily N-acetyltransferase